MAEKERQLKGTNFTGTLGAVERRYGRGVREAVEQRMPGEAGESLRTGTLLASGWYPASWYHALLATIAEVADASPTAIRDIAREAVRDDFQTLFRVVRLFLSPQRALQQSLRISRRYIDGGEIEVVEAGRGLIHYRFREYDGYTRLMWQDFMGGIEAVLELLRVQDLTCRVIAGGGDGDDGLEVVFRWRE